MDAIKTLLDTFSELGINPLYVLAVIFITALLKSFDVKNKFKQGYVLFPLLASLGVCATITPFQYADWLMASCIHAAVGAYGYNLYSDLIKKRKGK
jgi:hypothetical protein